MKFIYVSIFAVFAFLSFEVSAYERRTDGAKGSEWSDFSRWDSSIQAGLQFGAVLPSAGREDANFGIGLDVDVRPNDLFGFRLTALQALESPRLTTLSLTPVVHTKFSNLEPYAYAGPGLALIQSGGSSAKFMLAAGIGADVIAFEKYGLGVLYQYSLLVNSFDLNSITARLSYRF